MRYLAAIFFLVCTHFGCCEAIELSGLQRLSEVAIDAQTPQVVVDDLGNAVALWQSREGMRESLKVATRTFRGKWSQPRTLRETTQRIKNPQVVLNNAGEVVVLWSEVYGTSTTLMSVALLQSGEWSKESVLSEIKGIRASHLSINDLGQVVAVWQRDEEGRGAIASAFCMCGEAWSEPRLISGSEGEANFSRVAINEEGNVLAVWEQEVEKIDVIMGAHARFGRMWSTPEALSDESTGSVRPQICMIRSGDACVLWEKAQGYTSSLQSSFYRQDLGWSVPTDLPNNNETVYEPQVAMNNQGQVLVVWRSTNGENFEVCALAYSAREGGEDSEKCSLQPVVLSLKGENAINPQVVLNNRNEGVVIWRQSKDGLSSIQGMTFSEKSLWSSPFTLTEESERVAQLSLSLNNEGQGVALWRQKSDDASFIQSEALTLSSRPSPMPSKEEEAPPQDTEEKKEPPPLLEEELTPKKSQEKEEFVSPPPPIKPEHEEEAPPQDIEEKKEPPPLLEEELTPKKSQEKEEFVSPPPPIKPEHEEETAPPSPPIKEERVVPAHVYTPSPYHPPPAPLCEVATCCQPKCWLFEVRGSAYRPNEQLFRSIYADVLFSGGLLAGYSFFDRWAVVGSVEYMKRSGSSIGKSDSTKMQLIPISLLLRYTYLKSCCCDLYLGVGPRYFHLKTENKLDVVQNHVTSDGFGGVAETGLLFHIGSRVDIDIFVAWSYGKVSGTSSKTNIESNSVDVGGLQAGVGIGIKF